MILVLHTLRAASTELRCKPQTSSASKTASDCWQQLKTKQGYYCDDYIRVSGSRTIAADIFLQGAVLGHPLLNEWWPCELFVLARLLQV